MIHTITLSPAHQVALLAIAADANAWINQDAEVLAWLGQQNLIRPIMAWGFCLQVIVTPMGWGVVAGLIRRNDVGLWRTREVSLDDETNCERIANLRNHLSRRAADVVRGRQQAAAFDAIDPDEVHRIEMMGGQAACR